MAVKPQGYGVRWAPITGIPLERRLQTLAVSSLIGLFFSSTAFTVYLFIFHPVLWPVLVVYIAFIFFDRAPEYCGRRVDSVRRWKVWTYFCNYFPECDLDPTGNYVFGYHPHGIISFGAFANFGTEGTGFSEKFPGITPYLLTLPGNFRFPFFRDLALMVGLISSSRQSCERVLSAGPGHSPVIVVGGATESLTARPGTNDLILRKRFGFIRLAIKQKASLVPMFSFGENDLYDQFDNSEGSTIFKVQKKIQSIFGFTMPLFHARGIFNYNIGIIPFRHPITTVVGKPIPVPEFEGDEPTQEQLVAVHALYIEELQSIYDKYKDVYAKDQTL
ncbi:diacylglycerol acyltransferase type 2B [Phycomyces nitens]|nr:diacylglycerol acyltransferase type 2B [Phycomyces nitens]